GIVVAVEVVHGELGAPKDAAAAPAGALTAQVIEAAANGLAVALALEVDAGAVEGDDAGGGAGESRRPAERLVAEAARVRVLAALDVIDATIARGDRHADAGVTRRPQGHDLADGDRQIGVAPARLVAPASLVILRVDDEPHRPAQAAAQ